MASGPAPNHDFAPAWLKIPTNSQRPSVGAVNNSNPDSGRRGGGDVSSFPTRQKTSSGRDRGRSSTAAGGTGFPPRQHSIDSIEESATQKGAQSAHVYKLGAAGQRQYSSSQPSLDRRSLARHNYRDLGRPSQNATSDHSGPVSGGRKAAGYDERHHSRDGQWPPGRQRSFERVREGRNKERIQRCKEEDIIQKFEQEFPSLIGGATEDRTPVAAPPNSSVWDSGKIGKIHLSTSVSKKLHLVQKPIRNEVITKQRSSSPVGGGGGGGGGVSHTTAAVAGSPKPTTHAAMLLMPPIKNGTARSSSGVTNTTTIGSMYRALLPSKGLMVRRSSKENNSKTNGQSTSDKALNAQLVTQPSSLLSNKKSEFLKELKLDDRRPVSNAEDDNVELSMGIANADDKSNEEGNQPETNFSNGVSDDQDFHRSDSYVSNEQPSVNGIQIERSSSTDASEDNWVLSSSLEAEQRLLREMGWKEEGSEDEGVYAPLTEDEMKEMEHLSKVFQKRNGMQRNLHVSWSPKRILPIPKNLDPANEDGSMSSSSTSSDSDSD